MSDYKAVHSGTELSRRITDCLEASAPRAYEFEERTRTIRSLNDILQSRSTRSVDELLAELDKCKDTRLPAVREEVQAFLRQKELLTKPYNKRSSGKQFVFQWTKGSENRKLKVIDQKLYDRAAREGFPANFFRESCFDHVTFYCLPDTVDFCGSELHGCKFAVCRMEGISFGHSHIYDTEFYSSILNHVDMYEAVLSHTHFHDCELSHMMVQRATLKSCHTTDCTMDNVDYAGSTLDGCTFNRITAGAICLDWTSITQAGATAEECRQNKDAIYKALGVQEAAA